MTAEEKKKQDEANQVKEIPSIQSNKADIEEKSITPTVLNKIPPVDKTPPAESSRQYAGKVKDYSNVVDEAAQRGIDLDKLSEMPLMDSDKNQITDAVRRMYPRELAQGISSIAEAYAAPQNEARNAIDTKRMMNLEKRKRRARVADAFYAFGEGLQGKTANSDNFASTRIQRKQDEQFQNYKDITERNQKTKYLWENQYRKDLMAWAEEKANDMNVSERERAKFQQLADQFKQNMDFKNKQLKQQSDLGYAKIAADKEKDKDEKAVTVQTAKNTYQLKPEEAEFYKGEVLKDSEKYRSKYPGLFEKVQETDEWTGKPIEGKFTYKLNPRIKDVDLIRVWLEENKEGGNEKITPENQNSYFDKYRKEKGLPTSEIPASETTKQPLIKQQQVKADPLGLGL